MKKKGRGRPKGSPNKPLMELITERANLPKNADVYEILCQAELVAQEDTEKAANGLRVFNNTNGAVQRVIQWAFDSTINSTLPEGPTPFKKNDAPASDLSETSLRSFKSFPLVKGDRLVVIVSIKENTLTEVGCKLVFLA